MRFNGNVLVKIEDRVAIPQWLEIVSPTPRILVEPNEDSNRIIQDTVNEWTENFGRQWIDYFANTETTVTCQEGNLILPIDRWHCKITGELCPIQAQVPRNDKEQFLQGCNIDEFPDEIEDSPMEYKEKLWGAIHREQYTGEHHKSSRYICVRCEEKGVKEYLHFPWELTYLADHLASEQASSDPDFVLEGLASQIHWPICANCFLSLPNENPSIDFKSFDMNFDSYRSIEYSLDYS